MGHMDNTDTWEQELKRVTSTRNTYQRMVILALRELGLLTTLECAWEECPFPSRSFDPSQRNLRLEIDHIISQRRGGTEHPTNLRLVHRWCNGTRSAREMAADANHRIQLSEKAQERWANSQEYRDHMQARWDGDAGKAHTNKMQEHWADPIKRERHAQAIRDGNRWIHRS